jgi:hypothetical protein
MTKWKYLTAPILTHAVSRSLDSSAPREELVPVAPGMNRSWPSSASQSLTWCRPRWSTSPRCVDGDRVFTSGQLSMNDGLRMTRTCRQRSHSGF